jgi:hypothetical protein
VFWIGFSLAMFPGAALAKRHGTLPVIAVAAVIGTGATWLSNRAASIDTLIAAQVLAGGAWGCVMMAAFSAAIAFGRTGREGTALGLLFGMLAFATLARIGAVAAQLHKAPEYTVLLTWAPVALWAAGATMFAILAMTRARREAR